MRELLPSLIDADPAIFPVLAQRWKVDITNLKPAETAEALANAMLDESNAARVYEELDDAQRGALQTLAGSGEAKVARSMFLRMFGELRKPARGLIEREKPHQNPRGPAEALFYRGLIFEAFEQAPAGVRAVLYVPPDLLARLPLHKTAYDDLPDSPPTDAAAPGAMDDDTGPRITELDAGDVDDIHAADTSLVDDLITLLAHIQNQGMTVANGYPADADLRAVYPYLLVKDPARLAFLFAVGASANLLQISDENATVQRTQARRWLEASRGKQVQMLVESWHTSRFYRELWHVSGLHPEPGGWPYDPVVAREAITGFLRDFVPREAWWSLDEFITTVKEIDPDFQRPNGDYDQWYIRNDTGDYLNGFESWDAVEGAQLEFTVNKPLHWLGMVDLGEDAARLTAYGRAFLEPGAAWPDPPITPEPITVQPDGTMSASRRAASIDRFQLARFTTWVSPATLDGSAPYVYRLNAQGIQQAARQGIETGHIAAFITRVTGDSPVPKPIQALLEKWQSAPADDGGTQARGSGGTASLERMIVLRTTSQETLDYIVGTPALRRYLGARLGPMAVAVRPDQWEALQEALGAEGIEVHVRE